MDRIEKGDFVVWLSKAKKEDVNLVGEKGANLGELLGKNFPIPEGFIVTTKSYFEFLQKNEINSKIKSAFDQVNSNDKEKLETACKEIKTIIEKSEFPEEIKEEIIEAYETLGANKQEIEKGSAFDILNSASEPIFVSVRGSLPQNEIQTNSVREQNTYLNVKGNDVLLDHIKSCFASLFNPKTLRRELSKGKKISDLGIAVLIQKMIMAEKSGFILSRNPSKNLEIHAIWGIGEGFNLKEISPDEYEVSEELEFVNKRIGEKKAMVVRDSSGALKRVNSSEERKVTQVLNSYEIQRLGDLAEKIEMHFQKPQRIDFSVDESGIYILQTREVSENQIEKISSSNAHQESGSVEKVEKVTRTKIKLILEKFSDSEKSSKSALKKVGVEKIENEIRKTGKHPNYFLEKNFLGEYEKILSNGLEKISKDFDEVWIRLDDFASEKDVFLEGAKKEENPLMGLHGIRFGLRYPQILKSELNAIKKISGKTKTGILIPNIISIEEIKKVKEILNELNMENVLIGVLIETPASVQLIKDICSEKVNLISINTERLLQYLLAVDGKNSDLKKLLNYSHPAFMYQLEYLVRVAKRNGVETNIFGPALENEDVLKEVLQRGVDFICVPATDAKKISEKIYSIEKEILGGTDLEPRKYEMEKVKKEYLKEEALNPEKEDPKIEEAVKAIEEEKQEYLSQSHEENL